MGSAWGGGGGAVRILCLFLLFLTQHGVSEVNKHRPSQASPRPELPFTTWLGGPSLSPAGLRADGMRVKAPESGRWGQNDGNHSRRDQAGICCADMKTRKTPQSLQGTTLPHEGSGGAQSTPLPAHGQARAHPPPCAWSRWNMH